MAEELAVVTVYPELLGTYGDGGNALALAHRARARGIAVRRVEVAAGEALPRHGDVYLLGGGEDAGQLLAARELLMDDHAYRVLSHVPCLAVCAGLQILSRTFDDAEGKPQTGLGLLDVTCGRLVERAVGEVVAEPDAGLGLPTLTGFENHQGGAVLGDDARPLARLVTGVGNGDGLHDGAMQGGVIATYLHGPVLVRNPGLADLLIRRALGGELPPYLDAPVEELRAERLDAADPRRRTTPRLPRTGRAG